MSSSSSSSNSSMSSLGVNALFLNDVLINQNLNTILPFVYYGEDNFQGNGTTLSFKFRTSATSYFDYSNILNPQKSSNTPYSVYIPETDDSRNTYSPIFFVDLITDDKSGISKISARGQPDRYETRKPKYTFVIPKFSWKNTNIKTVGTGTAGLENALGSVWIGTDDKKLYKVEYSLVKAIATLIATVDSEIDRIVFNPDGNSMYLTSYDHFRKYTIDNYLLSSGKYTMTVNPDSVLYNDANKKIVYNKNNELWSVNSYLGTINKLDLNEMTEIFSFAGLDAPFKIMKSEYHNFYIVAGTNILWKFDGTSIKALYEIGGYRISDFDISKNGEVAITFNGMNDSIFRILDKNFYRILHNKDIDNGQFRYCKYCSTNNKFYAVAELLGGTYSYSLSHNIYDISSGSYFNLISSNTILDDESSNSDGPVATQKIEISAPLGGEVFIYGQKVTIKWKSTQSVKDPISIDLYKSDDFYKNIVEQMENKGSYEWTIPNSIEAGSTYKIQITWLAPSPNDYSDISPNTFTIDESLSSSSGLIIPVDVGQISGIDFDTVNENVVLIVKSGYLGFFNTNTNIFTGLLNLLNIIDINCMAIRNEKIKEFDTVTKVRMFVGTQMYLNDKWDSGEISTNLTAMYYGGGNNLIPGEKYYVNIQVYSNVTGWSEVQTREFIMPNKPDII